MRYCRFILCFLVAAFFGSCKETAEDIQPLLNVSINSISFNSEGGTEGFTVDTNQEGWNVSLPEGVDWCTLETEDKTVKVTVSKNMEVDLRSTVISVVAGKLSKDISLEQSGSEPMLTLEKNNHQFLAEEGSVTVDISSNIADLTVSCNADWCIPTIEEDKLIIKVKANTEPEERTANVIIAGGGEQLIFDVFQEAAALSDIKLVKIDLPIDFSANNIINVMDGDKKIAEICHEYIASQMIPMDVIYPIKDGKADLSAGIVLDNGGTLVWNLENNTCEYAEGNLLNPENVWIREDGTISLLENGEGKSPELKPYYIVDVRGASSEIYKTVKIGTQYWMAENLRAEYYLDGTTIGKDWNSESGAYIYLYNNRDEYKQLYGALYDGYAVNNEAQLAPEGWEVPDNDDWSSMFEYIGKNNRASLLKSDLFDDKGIFTNLTGFNAHPAFSYSTATDFVDGTLETWFWSSSRTFDFLTGEAMYYIRMQKDVSNVVFNDDTSWGTFHSPAFGHSVRCVRK